jgi:CRISPR-associated protein Csb2
MRMTPTIPAMTRTTTTRTTTTEVPAMPTVKLRFPGGRYHATPWGHHVNEGLIDWPPSPWRLLRAFIACGFSSQGWAEIPPTARRLIDKLAAVLPLYRLPSASAAHSRHFMPVGVLAKGREQTTLVFDTWANVGDGELLIHWPCQLDADEADLLGELASALGYLGRSESWVEAQLTNDDSAVWNAVPCAENEHRGPNWEQVSLMAAISSVSYLTWQKRQADSALEPYPLPEGRKKPTARLLSDRKKAIEPYPVDLLSCLTRDTVWWKGHGWSQPPGSQRVLYWRRSDALQVGVPAAPSRPSASTVTTMLLALTTASGNRSALPPITRALPQAELFHRAVVSIAGKGNRVDCPELIGRDATGKPVRGNHSHAHTIPFAMRDDGRIDHIVVYAPGGLGPSAQSAIRYLKRTWTKGGTGNLQLALVGKGPIGILKDMQLAAAQPDRWLGPAEGANVWVSATPFVPPRHMKSKGRNTLVGQVETELQSRGLPMPEAIEILPELSTPFRHFVKRRSRGGSPPPVEIGFGLKLTFSQPVKGPILLGYACHFGLGRFSPAT